MEIEKGNYNDAPERADTDDEDIFNVEAIRDKRYMKNRLEYLVKWEGYPENQCTWEPLSNLETVKDMIDEFERNYKNKETPTYKPGDPQLKHTDPAKKVAAKPLSGSDGKIPKPITTSKPLTPGSKPTSLKNSGSKPTSLKKKKDDDSDYEASDDSDVEFSNGAAQKKIKMGAQTAIPVKKGGQKLSSDQLPAQGHYHYGDKAKRILNAKFEVNGDMSYVLCFVEWEPRKNGVQPLPTPLTNIDLRSKDPFLLLDFYESRLKISQNKEPANAPTTRHEESKVTSQDRDNASDPEQESGVYRSASQERIAQGKMVFNKYAQAPKKSGSFTETQMETGGSNKDEPESQQKSITQIKGIQDELEKMKPGSLIERLLRKTQAEGASNKEDESESKPEAPPMNGTEDKPEANEAPVDPPTTTATD